MYVYHLLLKYAVTSELSVLHVLCMVTDSKSGKSKSFEDIMQYVRDDSCRRYSDRQDVYFYLPLLFHFRA
jgi:hypothetical protein